jgi:hypothetical protein
MAKRATLLLAAVCLICVITGVAQSADNPFAGKWKMNPAKSRLTDQMKVEAAGPNKYNMIFSGDNIETIVADGTDQPGLYGSTLALSIEAPDSWKVVRKNNGKVTIIGLWKLSPDGKTLTDNFTGFRADGTTSNLHYIYQRTAGTSGFVGTWESVEADVNSKYEIEIQPFEGDGLSFINASAQMTQSLKFDGKDYPATGKVPEGLASSGRRISDRAVERTDKIKGKALYTQQIEVSPDGKTLTVTAHIPGQDTPNIMVFDRE